MRFHDLIQSKKEDLEFLGLQLHWASIVTVPCAAVRAESKPLKKLLTLKVLANTDLERQQDEVSSEFTLHLLLLALVGFVPPSTPAATLATAPAAALRSRVDLGELAAILVTKRVSKFPENWTMIDLAHRRLITSEVLDRCADGTAGLVGGGALARVLGALATVDGGVASRIYCLEGDSQSPTVARCRALCLGYELDNILCVARKDLLAAQHNATWTRQCYADLQSRVLASSDHLKQGFSSWRALDVATAITFLRSLPKVVAGLALAGAYDDMMQLAEPPQSCPVPLAVAFLDILESALRHLPPQYAEAAETILFRVMNQCDAAWSAARCIVLELSGKELPLSSEHTEQLKEAQQVLTSTHLCFVATLRLACLTPVQWVDSHMLATPEMLEARIRALVSLVPRGDGGRKWFFNRTPFHVALRRFTMLLCKLAPAVVGLLANMALEERANVVAVMGLLVGASRYATPESTESVIKACGHAWGLGQAHGYVLASLAWLLRVVPSLWTLNHMQEAADLARTKSLSATTHKGVLLGACMLLRAMLQAWAGHRGAVPEGTQVDGAWWRGLVWCLYSTLTEVAKRQNKASHGDRAMSDEESEDEDENQMEEVVDDDEALDEASFERREQLRGLLDGLLTCLPDGVILPNIQMLIPHVMELLREGVGNRDAEADLRRQLVARWGAGTQLIKAARRHIQSDAELKKRVEEMALHMLNVSDARGLFNTGRPYSDVVLRGGISFLNAALSALPMAEAHDGFIAQLLATLQANATDARMGDLLRCILETLVDIFTTWPRSWPDSILKRALAVLTCFSVAVKPGVTGLSRGGRPEERHFNWFVCGREAKAFAQALQHIAQAQQYDFDSLLPDHDKTEVPALLTRFVGSAPKGEDGEGEGEGQDEGGEMMLEEEWAIDSGE